MRTALRYGAHSHTCTLTRRILAGGIGKSIETVEQLEQLQRPLTMESGGMVLMDLLWRCVVSLPRRCVNVSLTRPPRALSDPTENDSITGLRPNARGPGLVTFGPDRVKEFCEANSLQMIIRAHECVMDGACHAERGALRATSQSSFAVSRIACLSPECRIQASSASRRAS